MAPVMEYHHSDDLVVFDDRDGTSIAYGVLLEYVGSPCAKLEVFVVVLGNDDQFICPAIVNR